jgi:O-antigen/teichoic acid export membrane protein
MDTVKRIAKNTTVLFASQLIVSFLFFLSTLYTARYLGTVEFGILSTGLALVMIFGLLSDLGLCTLTTREVSRDKSLVNKYTGNMIVIKIILAILTFGSILIVSILFYSYELLMVTLVLAISVVIDSFSNIFYSIFQAYEKMEYQAIGKCLASVLLLLGIIIVINYGWGVVAFASIYLFVSVMVFIYTLIICVYEFKIPKLEIDLSFWKSTLIEALPLSLALIFGVIYFRIDMLFLSILKGSYAVGVYSASYRLMDFLTFVPIIFTSSILPVLSRFHSSSKDSLKISYKLSFKYLLIIGLPIAFGVTILANDIILLVYGVTFTQSTVPLQIIIWTIPLLFLSYLLSTVITSINKQHLLYKIMFLSMITNIILNLLLIPNFSYLGSSFVTLISELVVFIFSFIYVSKFICRITVKKTLIKPLIACVFMGIILSVIHFNLVIMILIGSITYILFLFVLKTFSQEEINLFKKIIRFKT